MHKTYCRPTIVSERCYETSALSCAKTESGESIHLGGGSTYLSGHSAGSLLYSHTPGSGGPWLHVNPSYTSYETQACHLAFLSS